MRREKSVPAESGSGSFSSMTAAMSQARLFSCGVGALNIILAIRGWHGRYDILLPKAVMLPWVSSAPRIVSRDLAVTMLSFGGGVSQGSE